MEKVLKKTKKKLKEIDLEKLLFWAVVGVGAFGLIYALIYTYLLQVGAATTNIMIVGSFSDIVSILTLQGILINAVLLHRILKKLK